MSISALRRGRQPAIALALVVFAVVIAGQLLPYFASATNLTNILIQTSFVAVAAYGMTLVLLTGGIDLSVGGVMSLVGVVQAALIGQGVPWPLAVLIGLGTGAVLGLVNGLGVARLGLPPFIATFGTLGIAAGLALYLADAAETPSLPRMMVEIGNGRFFGMPYLVLIALAVLISLEIALRTTSWGVHLRASGNAISVARLAGVPVARTLTSAYLASGILSAAAGTLLASNLSTAGPLQGEPFTLLAVAACVIGGVDLFGGRGHLWAAALGAVFLSAIRSALNMQGVQPFMQGLITGVLIIAAVYVTTNGAAFRSSLSRSFGALRARTTA